MKISLQHLLSFSFFLALFSFSTTVFADPEGPPPIRQETRGGSGNPDCDLINNGEDQILRVCLYAEDISYFDNCDFHVGYDLELSDMTYVDANNWIPSGYPNGEWQTCFEISFSAEEIAYMCANKIDNIQLEFFCLNNGVYENIYDKPSDPAPIDLCCDPIDRGNTTGNNLSYISTPYNFELDANQSIGIESEVDLTTDYYIFDIHGNQINISKNRSIEIPVQQHLSTLNIPTGIYIIKYWDGEKMITEKVFKN